MKRGPPPISVHFDSRPSSPTSDNSSEEEEGSDSSYDAFFDNVADDGYHRALRARSGLQVAILRLNRSIYEECLPLLYSRNRIIFHTDPVTAARWLRARSTRQRGLIRHLGLSKAFVMTPVKRGGSTGPISRIIAHGMQIETVTMWVPRDEDPEANVDENEYAYQTLEWYRWAINFRVLLRDRKIGQLRLLFAKEENKVQSPRTDFAAMTVEPVFLPLDIDLNGIGVVKKLNRALDAVVVEPLARSKFEGVHAGLPGAAYEACSRVLEDHVEALKLGNKRTFTVSREDCCGVDEGTVVVLRLNPSVDEDWICQNRVGWEGHHRKAKEDL